MNQEWMNHPLLKDIDRSKLDFLQMLIFESQQVKPNEMVTFLVSVVKRGQQQNIDFSDAEISAVVEVLRAFATPEELMKIEKLMTLKKTRNKK